MKIDLSKHNYVLTRVNDNKQILAETMKFIEWSNDGTFKSVHDTPAIGRSIILNPGPSGTYQWLTTQITEIISDTEFKTKNSTYYLHKL